MNDLVIPDSAIMKIGQSIARLFAAHPHLKATEDTATVWIEEIYQAVPNAEAVIAEAVQRHIRRELEWPRVAQVIKYCHDVEADARRHDTENRNVTCGICGDVGMVDTGGDSWSPCECRHGK